MKYLHSRRHLEAGQIVRSYCSHQANFILLDDHNYRSFRNGQKFSYFGGFFKTKTLELQVPRTGTWNIVLDFSMHNGRIEYSRDFEVITP